MIKRAFDKAPPSLSQFLKFGMVGTLGFVIDTTVLYSCMLFLSMGPYSGRVVSFLVAVTATWFCNRHFTFKDTKGIDALHVQWSKFFIVCLGGFVFNYGSYAYLIAHNDYVAAFPVIGVAVGSLVGMFFNFFSAKHVVFRPRG